MGHATNKGEACKIQIPQMGPTTCTFLQILMGMSCLSRSKIVFLIGPFLLFGYYLDLIKDIILIYRLAHAIGGITAVFVSYEKFACMVSCKNIHLRSLACKSYVSEGGNEKREEGHSH